MNTDTKAMLTQKAMQVVMSVCLLIAAHVVAKSSKNLVLRGRGGARVPDRDHNNGATASTKERTRSSYALIFHTIGNLVYVSIMIVAIFISLKVVGMEATSIVALLGASGIALGLAVQGILGDIAAAIVMAILPSFSIGDIVSIPVSDRIQQGRVEDFTLTNTILLDTATGSRVTVPNRMLLDSSVVNHTSHPYHYINVEVPVTHGNKKSLASVVEFVSKFLQQNPGGIVRTDVRPVAVGVSSITDTATIVQARCVVDAKDFLGAEFSLRTAVAVALASSGIM